MNWRGGDVFDIFRSKKTIKENKELLFQNTVKILEKIIEYVKNAIVPIFQKKVIGKYYDFADITASHTSKSFDYTDKKQIYNYMNSSPLSRAKYPKILKYYYDVKWRDPESFQNYHFLPRLDKNDQIIYNKLSDHGETTIFRNMIEPIAKNLDIYLIIMYIKNLFYYRVSSVFDTKTLELVKKLENAAYKNEINSPEILIERIQEIINSINNSIPVANTPTKQ